MENKKFIVEFDHWERYVIFTDDGSIVAVIENSSLEKEVDMARAVCKAIKEHEGMSTCELLDDSDCSYDGKEFECELTHGEDEEHDIRTYKIYKAFAYRA